MSKQVHFGQWFKRVREKLGLRQRDMAKLLGLESGMAVHNAEKRPDRSMRGTTTEALLELLGYASEEELDVAAARGGLPDIEAIKARLKEAQSVARGVTFDPDLVAQMFRWLAAHPRGQLRKILDVVAKQDAAAVAQALVERVAGGDDGGVGGNGR